MNATSSIRLTTTTTVLLSLPIRRILRIMWKKSAEAKSYFAILSWHSAVYRPSLPPSQRNLRNCPSQKSWTLSKRHGTNRRLRVRTCAIRAKKSFDSWKKIMSAELFLPEDHTMSIRKSTMAFRN